MNADTGLPVHVDPDRITQVLTNLLGNALLATPAGGTVTVTARPTARGGEVVVTDTGVGLSEQDLERVFERFYRAPGPTAPVGRIRDRPDDRPRHRPRPRRGRDGVLGRPRTRGQLHPGAAGAHADRARDGGSRGTSHRALTHRGSMVSHRSGPCDPCRHRHPCRGRPACPTRHRSGRHRRTLRPSRRWPGR